MSDLTDFLLARIADDEGTIPFLSCECGEGVSEVDPLPTCPDRITAECAARRRTVERLAEAHAQLRLGAEYGLTHYYGLLAACQILASVYADHPDYQQEWKP